MAILSVFFPIFDHSEMPTDAAEKANRENAALLVEESGNGQERERSRRRRKRRRKT